MARVADYTIKHASSTNPEEACSLLTRQVRSALAEGWQPWGGVSMAAYSNTYGSPTYTAQQAVTKLV